MRPNAFMWVLLLPLLLAACGQSAVRPDPELVEALAAVRGDGPRVIRGADAVQAHLLAQQRLSELRAQALRRWCEGAEAAQSAWAQSHCPAPEGELPIISTATPVLPADVVGRRHEPGIDGGDWVVRVGDFVLVANQGRLISIDVSGPEGAPLRVADRLNFAPEAAGDSNSSARLLVQPGHVVLCSYSGRDQRSALIGLELAAGGRMQELWQLQIEGWNLCTDEQDRAYLYPDALVLAFRVDAGWPGPLRYRNGDEPWQSLPHLDELYVSGQVAPWPSVRVLLLCPLADLRVGKSECTRRTVLSDGNEVLYLGADAAYLLLAEAEDQLYLEPWMIFSHFAFPVDMRAGAESGGGTPPASARMRQTWVARVPLRDGGPIQMGRLGGWQFHPFPAAEVTGDLHVLTRRLSGRAQQSLALHQLEPSAFTGSGTRLLAPRLSLNLARGECVDQWLGEAWAWFAITVGHCGASPPTGGRAESARLHGIDLRSGSQYRYPLASSTWLLAPGGQLVAVSHAAREHLRLTLLPLGQTARQHQPELAPVLELAEFSPAETLSQWAFGPAYSTDAESGRVVLNLAVVRQHNMVAAAANDDPILDLLLLEVVDGRLGLLGATDLGGGSGWHPTQMESHWDDHRLLLTTDRLLLVGPGELFELRARDGRLISGARLHY